MDLLKTDKVLYAYAKPCFGPGWCNAPVIVVVKDKDGDTKERYLQDRDQTQTMREIYSLSADIHNLMVRQCEILQQPKKCGAKK
jgi:hypothetical protein